jgi:hypothetical protein
MASPLSRDTSLDFIADALERLVHSSAIEADRIYRWLQASSGILHEDAIDVLTNVSHFIADSDIRDRDQVHRAMQEKAMGDLIVALRHGEPREQLLMFNFLGVRSPDANRRL